MSFILVKFVTQNQPIMKKILYSAFVISIFAFQVNTAKMEENNLLDGTSLTYMYHDLGTVKMEFNNGSLRYEWIKGPFTGTIGGDTYKAKKIANKIYLVQWYESSRYSLVTLVLNFKKKQAHSSALLNPTTEEETVLFHSATIQKQNLVEK